MGGWSRCIVITIMFIRIRLRCIRRRGVLKVEGWGGNLWWGGWIEGEGGDLRAGEQEGRFVVGGWIEGKGARLRG